MADGSQARGVATLPVIQELATQFRLDAAAFVYTFKTVAMPAGHSDAEFVSCCLVAREHGLNPLTKELYFMKTKAGQIQPIVSVDGWMRKCNEHPQFDGMKFTDHLAENGEPISVTCTIYRKDRTHPIEVTEYFDECSKAGGAAWKVTPKRMLRHRALTQAARYAFGFAGIMDRDEFDQWQRMKDVTPKTSAPVATFDIPEDGPSTDGVDDIPPDDMPSTATIEDHQATLREMEKLLNGASAAEVRKIEADYADAMTAMDEDSRAEAIDMIEAAKAGVL